ncbi:MAG: DUF3410 domain-containing protein [Ignavibacteriales bacterium]|nr:DUF3410 domain-containing protein [Ignavibacteriales bacterium]
MGLRDTPMNLLVDENVYAARETFSKLGNAALVPGREIDNRRCRNADALIVRSTTKVTRELLEGTPVSFIGTATTGDDHIDASAARDHGAALAVARGCNAEAVVDYTVAAIVRYAARRGVRLRGATVGVIGVGRIGSRVAEVFEKLGARVFRNDPPRRDRGDEGDWRDLRDALAADVVTIHTPLTDDGDYPTRRLLGEKELRAIRPDAALVNAARGGVIDYAALERRLDDDPPAFILDVFESEPDFNVALAKRAFLATPHIAGYSLEGKANGTRMIYDALCRFLGVEPTPLPELPTPENSEIDARPKGSLEETLDAAVAEAYDVLRDDRAMKAAADADDRGKAFDELRKAYPLRREFSNYAARTNDEETLAALAAIRFRVI